MVGRNPQEGRESGEIHNFGSSLEPGHVTMNERRLDREMENLLREVDDLQKGHEIGWGIERYDARAPVGRLDSGEIRR